MNRLLKNRFLILVALVALAKLSEAVKVYISEEYDDGGWGVDDGLEDDELFGDNGCVRDVQCQERKWGHHSRCNTQTGRCECYDQELSWSKRETVRSKDGMCVIRKRVGDPCNTHKECQSIPGEAYCQYGHYNLSAKIRNGYKGSCRCQESSIWYNPSGKCLLKSTKLGDLCEVSDQCRDGTLGRLSTCDRNKGKCTCQSFGGASNSTKTIYFETLRKCFLKKEYNDTCTDDDECRANLGPDVKCGLTEYTDVSMCHCPHGKVCRGGGFSTSFSLKLILGILIFVVVIVAVCFVIRFCYRGKRPNKIFSANRTGKDATPANIGPAFSVSHNHNAESRIYENISASKPLLQPQQPVLYANLPQPMRFGCKPTSRPETQHSPQNFELSRLYPRLPNNSELPKYP